MISRDEIDHKAQELDLHIANVQRDYIFGWLLKSIFENSYLKERLILKGGNCFRKAYFPEARFSDDLDFSTETALDSVEFQKAMGDCCCQIQDLTKVKFNSDRMSFNEQNAIEVGASSRQKIYKVRLYFDDFYGEEASIAIAVRLDISEFDRIYLPTKQVDLIHPYSDGSVCSANLRCLSLEEMVANKMKCLLQRRHSHDLFDMAYVYLLRNEHGLSRSDILSVFLKKTIFQPSPLSAKKILLGLPFDFFKMAWSRYLICPIKSRFDFETASSNFNKFVEELFIGQSTLEISSLAFFPPELRNPIMDAARDCKLLKITYDGIERLVEPYALAYKRRQDHVAQEYFYCWDRTGGRKSPPGVKTLLNPKISSISMTEEIFEPRYEIELSKAGEAPKVGYFSAPLKPRSNNFRTNFGRSIRSSSKPTFTIQCPYCQKRFKRSTNDLTLRPHKSSDGFSCSSRRGYRV